MQSTLTKQQYKHYGPRPISGYAEGAAIWATVRFDDECGNGHNTFAITGQVREPGHRHIAAGGCMHEDIATAFPELAPLFKWHQCSTDGPLHYIGNTVHLAGDRDCWGGRKGEVRHRDYYVEANAGGTLCDWSGQPSYSGPKPIKFKSQEEAQAAADAHGCAHVREYVMSYHAGKERELDAARHSAVWLDATDDDLTSPGLEQRLRDRLPALLDEFRAAVESLGLVW